MQGSKGIVDEPLDLSCLLVSMHCCHAGQLHDAEQVVRMVSGVMEEEGEPNYFTCMKSAGKDVMAGLVGRGGWMGAGSLATSQFLGSAQQHQQAPAGKDSRSKSAGAGASDGGARASGGGGAAGLCGVPGEVYIRGELSKVVVEHVR